MTILLGGDIGGTKTILRLVDCQNSPDSPQPLLTTLDQEIYPSEQYPDLVPIVKQFLARQTTIPPVAKACFGIAGPVVNNSSELTNLSWFLTGDRLSQELQIERVKLINDFAAIGYGVIGLAPEELHNLQSAPAVPEAPIAVIGAGTGLGEGFLIPVSKGKYRVFASEGSHADFAPRSSLEYQLLNYLLELYNIERLSVERVVSGPGITSIYRFLHDSNYSQSSPAMAEIYRTWLEEMDKPPKNVDLAAKIASFAQDNSDYLCYQTMKIFVEAYGAEAGNLALKLLPYGGLYIAGGIAAKNLPLMTEGSFMKAFRAKGRMTELLSNIPVHIVLNAQVGLMGAVYCASQLWARVDWILQTAASEASEWKNVLHHGFHSLGRTWEGLDVIFGFYRQKSLKCRKNADQQLEKVLLSCQEKMLNSDQASFADKLHWRGDGKQPRAVALAGESMLWLGLVLRV